MKLLLISSVIPQETMATELVLFRHFAAAEGKLEVVIASDHPDILHRSDAIPIYPHPLLLRLTKTRLAPFAHSLRHWPITFDCRALQTYLQCDRPDAILTVAHGELYQIALQTAQQLRIPLITFFHDWMPDLAWIPATFRPILLRRFFKLYRQSQAVFCVSQEMQRSLGTHPHAIVLPPIPGKLDIPQRHHDFYSDRPFILAYAGNLADCYGPLIKQLGIAMRSLPALKLQLFGQHPDWPEQEIQQFKDWDIYHGFLPRTTLLQRLSQVNALLVVMSFESKHRKRMETSFPSKLVEYCQLGKPLIIWGPEYCTAVQWARTYEVAEVVTSPEAASLLQVAQQLSEQQDRQKELTRCMCELANKQFNPNQIQQQFMETLSVATHARTDVC